MWFSGPIEVIPAVDVLGEEAVRLHRGDYDSVVERADSPAALARRWAAAGAARIHLVDLDGARSGRVRPQLVAEVAAASGLPVQASGGIRRPADAEALLAAGAERVVVGTAAWPDPSPWLELGDALVLALDVRDGEVRVAGWTEGTGLAFERALDLAGTLAGPDVELVETAAARGLRVLAAGGVRSPADVEALAAAGAEAAIVGRALLATR